MSNCLYNYTVQAPTIDEAWSAWIAQIDGLASRSSNDSSRDGNVVGEIINATTIITDPTRCIMLNPLRKMPMRYAIGEMLWYMSGNPTLKAIGNYTKAWERMSDDGETVNSNYGYIIQKKFDFDQYEYCKLLLKKDPNSRQAVIHIKTPLNTIEAPTKDLNCTVMLQFFIRSEYQTTPKQVTEPKLHMTVYMRSNDLWMGFPYDIFNFTALQIRMAMELGVGIGTYTHIAGSLHMYERNYEELIKNRRALEPSQGETSKVSPTTAYGRRENGMLPSIPSGCSDDDDSTII